MLSVYGTPTTVSMNSSLYIWMLAIGTYTEHFSGTQRECKAEEDAILAELIDVD